MTLIDFLFDVNAYPARWQCGAWSPTMGWLHIISDAIIFLAYMGIPITLLYFRKRFKDVKVDFAIVLFSAFIFLCGVTHLNDAIVFWYPFYNFAGLIKAMTAVVSLMTLVVIGIKVPKVIKLVNEKTASKIFKEIINCSPQGILVVKGDGNIVFANEALCTIFSTTKEQIIGKNVAKYVPDSVRQKHYDLRAGYMKDPRKRQMGSGRDLYALSEDNREIPVEIGLNPIIYNHEQCVLCSIVDITERKSKEDELKVLNESLKQSNKDLEEFTYIASHDLKEPLRGIHNYSMMLYEKYHSLLDEDGIKKLTTLPKLTQRLESQIDSLLSYSRVGKKGLELSPQKVHDLINNSKELINYQLESRCVKLDIAPDLPVVIGDKIRLTEVFSNLMSNAIKYNDNDIPEIKIGALKQSENDKQKGKVCIYVKDNGIGIKEEHLSKIFTIFKRLHPKTKYEGGTGVGLTIVKKIIEKHGGEITVESELGQGTTFYIALQAAENGIND